MTRFDAWGGARDVDEHGIERGSFTEERPYTRPCGSQENHADHKERRVITRGDGSRYYEWNGCPGWETTHVIEVREEGGRVIGQQRLDLREALEFNGSTNDPVLTLLYEADEAKKPRPSNDELLFGVAASRAAPEVCPWDSDRCHEHLYEFAQKLEEGEE